MIINGNTILSDIIATSNQSDRKGYRMPFKCLDELYSIKLGHTTYMVGHEYNGKTEFVLERDVWLAKEFKVKTAIFTPETGSIDDIFLEIAHKWCGQSLIGDFMDYNSKMKVLSDVSQYFFVIHTEEGEISMDEIFDSLTIFESENQLFIENIVIDPFNEIKFDLGGLARDMWLEKQLGAVRRKVRKEKRHITIITHPIESDRLYSKEGYLLPPSRKQYAGGQAWARKGESMISIWRPPYDKDAPERYKDEHGIPYSDSECHIIINKSKPKGTGMTGKGILFFDWKRSAYYELIAGEKYYAGEWYAKHETVYPLKTIKNDGEYAVAETQAIIKGLEEDPF